MPYTAQGTLAKGRREITGTVREVVKWYENYTSMGRQETFLSQPGRRVSVVEYQVWGRRSLRRGASTSERGVLTRDGIFMPVQKLRERKKG